MNSMNSIEGKIRDKLPKLQAAMIEGSLTVYPQSAEEISSFIKFCNDEKISMMPVGSGTQMTKSDQAGLYLSTRKMNKIVELAKADMTVSVEAGITIKELSEALKEYNFLLPVSYHEKPNSTIGGLLARDAGGIEQYARGTIHDYVLGLEFVTPTGEIIKTGGKTVKNVTGYDFTRMFANSWGTLGVVVKATFKLIPMPVKKALFITHAVSIDELTGQMKEVLAKRYALVTFMGMSGKVLELEEKYGGVFVLAGSEQAVNHQMDSLNNLLDIKQVITGTNNVDDYLENLLNSNTSDIILGTDRRTLLNRLPGYLDKIFDKFPVEILLDGGRGLVQLKAMHNHQELKEVLKNDLQYKNSKQKLLEKNWRKTYTVSFSDDRAPIDVLYARLKKNLDPNLIMYPNNPKFVEVS